MNIFISFILAIISSMLIDNVVLSRFYGICPFLGVSKKVKSSLGMGLAVVFVIMLATLICWPLYNFILVPAGIPFLDTVAYILVIACLVQLVGLFIKKYSPTLYKSLGIYLPLITTNCAVLGVAQGNTDQGLNFLEALANGLGTSIGFLLIIVTFSCIRTRLESANTPKAFKGLPIALITAAIMAIALMGLQGLFSGVLK
ncbi:MAG: RnfABCDGE type electron transport complex subunit A [Bacilli bacterium]|nr:RnfABCDGE type electron transport complex subunit A [Bacilli bacterium]MBO4682915.1 RnfABCDGE type electron transport complex subunit A [Bacilli bacterium]